MKQIVPKIKGRIFIKRIFYTLILLTSLASCEQYELPEAGTLEDKTPPTASFIVATDGSYLAFKFTNVSTSATDYAWTFGDGSTSTDLNPNHVYTQEGDYTVTLTASDKLGVTSVATEIIKVVKPPVPVVKLPEVLEPGFDKGNDSRYAWRTSETAMHRSPGVDPVIQISTTKYEGTNSAKLPNDQSRYGYQVLDGFSQNATYVLTYWYRMKNGKSDSGVFNLAIVKTLTEWNLTNLPSNTIAANAHGEDASNTDTWAQGTLEFNTGNHTSLAILFYNTFEEMNVDSFILTVKN